MESFLGLDSIEIAGYRSLKRGVYSSRLSLVVDPGRKSNCSIILGGKVVKHSDSYRLGSLPSDITEDVSLFIKTNLTVQY